MNEKTSFSSFREAADFASTLAQQLETTVYLRRDDNNWVVEASRSVESSRDDPEYPIPF